MGMPGMWEWIIIFLVVLLVFGARRLPEIAQGLGKGIKEFKRAVKDTQEEIKTGVEDDEKPAAKKNNSK